MRMRIVLWLLLMLPVAVLAETQAEGDEANKVIYLDLVPSLVGNYGSGPRLRYYKADVALRVAGEEARARVEHHESLIRDQLVQLFSRQAEETMVGGEGRERLRLEALARVQEVLREEEGAPLVSDLLFNNLIVR